MIMAETNVQEKTAAGKAGYPDRAAYRIGLFCFATMLFWFSMYTYVPFLTPYAEGMGASHKAAGIIAGSYGLTQMLLRIPLGVISDRLRKRKIFITLGMLVSLLSGTGFLFAGSTEMILLSRALAGVAAATWVSFTILFSSYYHRPDPSKAIGTISFFSSAGQMAGMYAGSLAADKLGEAAAFILSMAAAAAGTLLSFLIVEKTGDSNRKISMKAVASVAADKTLLTVSAIAILSQIMTFATTMGFTPVYARDVLMADKYHLGLLTLFSSLPAALASLAAGRYLAGKFGERAVIVTGFLLSGIFTLTIPFTGSFQALVITQILSGFGRGLSFTLLMSMSIKHMPEERRATAMGFFQSIYGLGMFIGPVVMGILGDAAGLPVSFTCLGTIGIGSAVFAYFAVNGRGRADDRSNTSEVDP